MEREFQGWVVDVFRGRGWLVKHAPVPMVAVGRGKFVPDPRGRGLLDLLMIHSSPPALLFAECKSETGKVSDDQREVIELLRGVVERVREAFPGEPCPIGVHLFRPGAEAMIEAIAARNA